MIPHKATVVVGMSGGVDSSVAALLLKQQGYHVIGMFMKNWDEQDDGGICQSAYDYQDVVAVCEQIGIPHYTVNFVKEYWERVFERFVDELKQGMTPNPDILCNREIKFKALLEKALELGADYLATGHYCQKGRWQDEAQLLRGRDPGKDQSYFLYSLKAETLEKVLFPIGGMVKADLRKVAHSHGLVTAQKKDSTGICFIGKRNFKQLMAKYIPFQPGNFETLSGKVVGHHDGVAFYTIGQRKGLGIGGAGEAWFVVGKDVSRNVVYVEQGSHHPALFVDKLTAVEVSWVSPTGMLSLPFTCKAKVRYRQPDQDCVIEKAEKDKVWVKFLHPQRAVTPRQSIVFYKGEVCLGGGMIVEAQS